MAGEHWIVIKQPEPNHVGWAMAIGTGKPNSWQFVPGSTGKSVWAAEALRAAIKQAVSIDLTISPANPKSVMADPDYVASDHSLTLLCRETKTDRNRWALLTLDSSGEFRLGRIAVGRAIDTLLEEIIGAVDDSPFDRSVILLRPDWFSTDILPAAVAA